ncbi:hypothetical protein AZKH_1398 [Azoarcus sp. KH32C]|nr:hypothetical protein AZKH_1398 [Azoarcus sp. KH32C]
MAAEKDILACERAGARIVSVLDDDFPKLLKDTADSPFFLYIKGQWPPNPLKSVAVIGTRQPTEHGGIIAKRITTYLSENGWSIVSGLATGCDAIAHRASLDRFGHTVAVLAHGLHTVTPKQHERLAAEILDRGGALVTEYAFGVDPIPPNFVKRDRIQAGLARGVVMVQSDLKGGSLHASRAALDYGRILAVPEPTERDLAKQEQKAEANRVMAFGSDSEKLELLKRSPRDNLEGLFILHGKDDYDKLVSSLEAA